ncbi:MAG TPA: pentapeptide repeat-containing protein [Euzebyales bacterium]|nr:pentapeptide repeat-containing protein [Euzebyales bacterium]
MLLVLVACPASAQPTSRETMSAQDFVRRVGAAGIDEEHVDVEGTVDLRELERVGYPVRCNDCTISGSLLGSDVIFERIVDLSGTRIDGGLDLHRASFREAFLLQAPVGQRTEIAGTTDLDLTTFGRQAGFDRTRFRSWFTARNAHVAGNASFVESEFVGDARLDRAVFAQAADFSMSTFRGDAAFARAHANRTAVFSQARFDGRAIFEGANFHRGADFTLAVFNDDAIFDAAAFGGATAFRFVQSYGLMSLERARVSGAVDLGAADLVGGLSLSALTGTETLSLGDAIIDADADLFMESVRVPALLMDLDDVQRIRGSVARLETLALLEDSAKQAGDLATANSARFELLQMQNGLKDEPVPRLLEAVFYRSISGYLVRPSHPLVALLLAMLLAATLRAIHLHRLDDRPPLAGRGTTARQAARALHERLRYGARLLWAGLAGSAARLPGVPGGSGATHMQAARGPWASRAGTVETVVYRILLAVLLISIGNSSSTIREVIDAVRA